MSAAHTPGPWAVRDMRDSQSAPGTFEVRPPGVAGQTIARGIRQESDARLIAAAPQLAEALRALLEKIDVMSGCNEYDFTPGNDCWPEFERARAALTAAGVTP